jgi:hypothetical protein
MTTIAAISAPGKAGDKAWEEQWNLHYMSPHELEAHLRALIGVIKSSVEEGWRDYDGKKLSPQQARDAIFMKAKYTALELILSR